MGFQFHCQSCGEIHHGMPSFDAAAPISYYAIPKNERETRCDLGSDDCIIDKASFFVRGCIEIPVHGEIEPFSWGVWVSLSEASYQTWRGAFDLAERGHLGPFFGWLNAHLSPYPNTINLKTRVHLRNDGIRPYIELEPTDHPLAQEQRSGISPERAAELYALMMHD
ncbi:hypothetical protein GCM10007907_05420 [Chitinimonas prasina]|uniref:DUF2199 domain-containing protein n=1 Tax=Chitinimonas prasina TaxID=1434937 RepID=A0ABQ5YBF4_9NEIS|nr:DUF2199 domain-containing protein [Chitinimonas prasina]GLR11752.1 hypothetical protein GCM10007907_05420 [Chitinimonas prasina]